MKTVMVTTTFYKSSTELRFQLAQKFVDNATRAGHTVVVVDGSPPDVSPKIQERLRGLGALIHPELHQGMGSSRRQAFFHAHEVALKEGAGCILWSEPEKHDLIRSVERIVGLIEVGMADIVIPCRSEASWETWPAFQMESEQQANAVYNKALGVTGFDPMFGPVAFSLEMAPHFVLGRQEGVEDTYVQHYAPIIAYLVYHARVKSVGIDMVYPPEQKALEEGALNDEMREKRRWQLETLMAAYRHLAAPMMSTRL